MRTLGNILWHFPFLGFINAFFTYVLGLLLTVTVVAAPLGLGLLELGKFSLGPFGRAMVRDSDLDPNQEIGAWKAYSWLVMVLWFPFGLFLSAVMVVQILFLCCSIFGIPVAIVVAKAIGTVFNPVGKRCVSIEAAEELRRRAAVRELDGVGRVEPVLRAAPQSAAVSEGPILEVRPEDRSRPHVSAGQPPHLSNGVKIALAAGAAVVVVVFLGFKVVNAFRPAPQSASTLAATELQPPIQKMPEQIPVVAPLAPPPPPVPTSYSGVADVVDTATLSLNGQTLPLAGLRSVGRSEADAAARAYLAQAGAVKCDPAPVGGWHCVSLSKGLDIAEVFALSGFAKAAANAPDFIRNAEGMARQNHRGVWGAS